MKSSEIFFRCSSLAHIMPGPREKAGELQQTTKTHLVDVFVSSVYKRRDDIMGKALEKGTVREEDSITLYSRVSKHFFNKNDQRLWNDWISGEPDLFIGKSIGCADEVIDIKTSWSATTFFRSKNKPLEDSYYWQGQGYMDLTGAKKHTVVYCLVNSPANIINDEKRKMQYYLGVIDPENDEIFKAKCRQIEINHIFDIKHFANENPGFDFHNDLKNWNWDIPMDQRIHKFQFDRSQEEIDAMHKRVERCREWIEENLLCNVNSEIAA